MHDSPCRHADCGSNVEASAQGNRSGVPAEQHEVQMHLICGFAFVCMPSSQDPVTVSLLQSAPAAAPAVTLASHIQAI